MFKIIIPMVYIALEVMFQRYAFSTLSDINENTLHIMEWFSRLLMTCSVTLMFSYVVRQRMVLTGIAGLTLMLSGFLFDVVNSTFTPYERQMTSVAFLAERDHLGEREHLNKTLGLLTREGRKEGLKKVSERIMDNNKVMAIYNKANDPFSKPKKLKTRLHQMEQANQLLMAGMDVKDVPPPFPNVIKVQGAHPQQYAESVAMWALPGVLARENLTERTIMQAGVMIPLGLIISSLGILFNTALVVLNIIKMGIKLPDYDPVYQWAILLTIMGIGSVLWLYGTSDIALMILNKTL